MVKVHWYYNDCVEYSLHQEQKCFSAVNFWNLIFYVIGEKVFFKCFVFVLLYGINLVKIIYSNNNKIFLYLRFGKKWWFSAYVDWLRMPQTNLIITVERKFYSDFSILAAILFESIKFSFVLSKPWFVQQNDFANVLNNLLLKNYQGQN